MHSLIRHGANKFVKGHLPLVWYDCACSLHRFARKPFRASRTHISKVISHIPVCVDSFHFRKGHKGCRPGGSNPLPAVWPAWSGRGLDFTPPCCTAKIFSGAFLGPKILFKKFGFLFLGFAVSILKCFALIFWAEQSYMLHVQLGILTIVQGLGQRSVVKLTAAPKVAAFVRR